MSALGVLQEQPRKERPLSFTRKVLRNPLYPKALSPPANRGGFVMSRRNLPVGKGHTEGLKPPIHLSATCQGRIWRWPGRGAAFGECQSKIPSPDCGLQKTLPRRAPILWKGQQDGEGTFGLVGSPKENGWEVTPQTPDSSRKVLEVQGGIFPLVGARGRSPRGKGWAGTSRFL